MQDYQGLIEAAALQLPTVDLGKRLRPFLTSDGAVTEALANALRIKQGIIIGLSGADLVTEEGRLRALQHQGQIVGIQLALDAILRPLMEMDENDGTSE